MAFISNGTTMLDAGSFSVSLGALTHIKTLTASSSGTLSFVHGSASVVFNNTNPVYFFQIINAHPSTSANFQFQCSIDTGSNYNIANTSTTTSAYHGEGGQSGGTGSYYYIDADNANATSFASITGATSTENDSSASGNLFIFNPSGTTFAKHWISDINRMDFAGGNGYANRFQCGGYFNTTSAIDAIQFKFASGNIDAGTIKMYGLKDS